MLKLEAEIVYEKMPGMLTTSQEVDLSPLCVTEHIHKSALFRLLMYTDPTVH